MFERFEVTQLPSACDTAFGIGVRVAVARGVAVEVGRNVADGRAVGAGTSVAGAWNVVVAEGGTGTAAGGGASGLAKAGGGAGWTTGGAAGAGTTAGAVGTSVGAGSPDTTGAGGPNATCAAGPADTGAVGCTAATAVGAANVGVAIDEAEVCVPAGSTISVTDTRTVGVAVGTAGLVATACAAGGVGVAGLTEQPDTTRPTSAPKNTHATAPRLPFTAAHCTARRRAFYGELGAAVMRFSPPRYGWSASGTAIVPSACW